MPERVQSEAKVKRRRHQIGAHRVIASARRHRGHAEPYMPCREPAVRATLAAVTRLQRSQKYRCVKRLRGRVVARVPAASRASARARVLSSARFCAACPYRCLPRVPAAQRQSLPQQCASAWRFKKSSAIEDDTPTVFPSRPALPSAR